MKALLREERGFLFMESTRECLTRKLFYLLRDEGSDAAYLR
jgi:hypothetical protein